MPDMFGRQLQIRMAKFTCQADAVVPAMGYGALSL